MGMLTRWLCGRPSGCNEDMWSVLQMQTHKVAHDVLVPNSEIILVPPETDLEIVVLGNQLVD